MRRSIDLSPTEIERIFSSVRSYISLSALPDKLKTDQQSIQQAEIVNLLKLICAMLTEAECYALQKSVITQLSSEPEFKNHHDLSRTVFWLFVVIFYQIPSFKKQTGEFKIPTLNIEEINFFLN